ncbi:sortase [Clostridium baratii]|uniref:Sortase family protein, LPXTG-site transpeptidase n=1 Tax=Clostridium baratii TaxID=1561 RepID=A0A174V1E5_9CLOT|nr:class D sortase [Clostridium baratii]OPF50886.1 sortase [Clostridium baratii]OPF55007.1 sortase [Clostridium baratii]OPF57254.1 sortase [Clostridium baratii]OPF59209.1 sortase [Clostridium baratii]CUQ28583.1 sortase family protein%2C LPXTG-site transpeptidase [Clostridium baratii]
MKGTGKKKSKFVTILGVLLVICGLALIVYPFIEIKLDEKDISKNISEWDKKKVEVAKDVKTNNKSNQKYPTVNIDGKDIIGKIIVVKTGEQIPILMGATEENLRGGATLYDNGVFPGEEGTAIVLGHRETTFGFLEDVNIGDEIDVETVTGTYKFKLKKTYITNPEDKSILAQEKDLNLTLVTCYPFRYVGPAPDRFIAKLELIK